PTDPWARRPSAPGGSGPVRTLLGGEDSPAAFRSVMCYRLTASSVRRASGATPSPGLSCPSRRTAAPAALPPRSRGFSLLTSCLRAALDRRRLLTTAPPPPRTYAAGDAPSPALAGRPGCQDRRRPRDVAGR